MKKTIRLVLTLTVVLSLFAAIPVGAGAEGQTINALITSDPSTLDCARFLGIIDRNILHSITEPLTRIENGIVTPAGAESWTVSDDGLTYTFTLRENQWDDGERVTARDYVYALRREADPKNAWSFASDFFSIVNFEAAFNGAAAPSEIGALAEDDRTLVITLNAPNPAFLSTVDIFPCRESDVEAFGDSYGSEAGTVSSCGPFKMDTWVHNSELSFSRNAQYWDAEHVLLDGFTDQIIPDESAQMASLENGSLDYATVSTPEYAAKFDAHVDLYVLNITTDRTAMIVFNCEDPVLSNAKIRQAFSLALDRELIIEITNGGLGTPAYGLVPTVCYVGDVNFREATKEPLLALLDTDPAALLLEGMEEAGLGADPSKLTLQFTWRDTSATGRTYAELYQQMWEDALGVKIEIDFNESALASIREGNYQIGSVGWGSTYEPLFQLSRWSTGGQSRWVNADYAALVSEGSASMDDAVRLAKYQQAEAMLVTEAAIAPTYYNATQTYAYTHVDGIPTNPFDTTGMKTFFINK
ncbi:MAG: peptide ABC transporter substrate-binding protein [Oscillospiraceae bacterium]|nr:peptide ABC transporter substrate-binding protein [Oscillospiraceae bacterium]